MGVSASKVERNSLQVIRVGVNTPAADAGILPVFHYIVEIEGDLVESEKDIQRISEAWKKGKVEMAVYDSRIEKTVTFTVKKKEEEKIGFSLRMHRGEMSPAVFKVIDVDYNSSAIDSRLQKGQDYIIGGEEGGFSKNEDIAKYAYSNRGKQIFLWVYNTGMCTIRKVKIVPTKEGLLGCEIGEGICNTIPYTEDKIEIVESDDINDTAKDKSQDKSIDQTNHQNSSKNNNPSEETEDKGSVHSEISHEADKEEQEIKKKILDSLKEEEVIDKVIDNNANREEAIESSVDFSETTHRIPSEIEYNQQVSNPGAAKEEEQLSSHLKSMGIINEIPEDSTIEMRRERELEKISNPSLFLNDDDTESISNSNECAGNDRINGIGPVNDEISEIYEIDTKNDKINDKNNEIISSSNTNEVSTSPLNANEILSSPPSNNRNEIIPPNTNPIILTEAEHPIAEQEEMGDPSELFKDNYVPFILTPSNEDDIYDAQARKTFRTDFSLQKGNE